MRVLLGHSYFLRFDPKLWRAMQPYPPLGTLSAAALVREQGHDVAVFDAMLATSTAEWTAMLDRQQPRVAVLFEDNFNYLSKMCLLSMRAAAFEMIVAAQERGCVVVVAGADVSDHAEDYLRRGADFALLGEGDETLCELLHAIESDATTHAITGLAFVDESGNVVSNGRRANLRDLDALPLPAHDLIDLDGYRQAWQRHGRFSMNIVTSRGCPFHCNWCAKPIWGQRYSVRSPASVVTEMAALKAMGAEQLWFMDDILGLKPGWLLDFAGLLEARDLHLPFKCLGRADLLLRPGEIDALKRAGCELVWIGAESGSQRILDAMEKGTSVEQIREARQRLGEAGIGVAFFLQFGYQGETWDDIQATLALVRESDPDDIGMSVSYPLPGTPFYERVREGMGGRQNWVDSEDLAMLYDGPYPTEFYHHLHEALHTEFRLRRAVHQGGLRTVLRAARTGRAKPALALLRNAAALPLARGRLELARRRARPSTMGLPVKLTRDQAATPSGQDDAIAITEVGRRR